jgi:hypothetical protein
MLPDTQRQRLRDATFHNVRADLDASIQCVASLLPFLLSLSALVAQDVQPARFVSGSVPLPPPQTVGWLEAILHVSVSAAGTVTTVETLRATEPLAGMLRAAIEQWRFEPAAAGCPGRIPHDFRRKTNQHGLVQCQFIF